MVPVQERRAWPSIRCGGGFTHDARWGQSAGTRKCTARRAGPCSRVFLVPSIPASLTKAWLILAFTGAKVPPGGELAHSQAADRHAV